MKVFIRSIVLTCLALTLGVISGCGSTTTGPTVASVVPSQIRVTLVGRIIRADGSPVAGAVTTASVVSSSVKPVLTGVTDADGRFSLTNIELLSTNHVMFAANAAGFAPYAEMLFPTSSTELTLQVKLSAYVRVPLQGNLASTLETIDPPTYVGDPYDSAYLWQAQSFYFEAPGPSDLDVVLTFVPAGNARLVMAASDATGAWAQDSVQRIRIPHGSSGQLWVGQAWEGGKLAQKVGFTLTVTPVG